jgi:hypothetical protein
MSRPSRQRNKPALGVARVNVKPATWEAVRKLQGAAGSLSKPLPWKDVQRIAHEDHTEGLYQKMKNEGVQQKQR